MLVSYLHRPGYGKAIAMGIMVFLLIMLRPAFLFLLPIFFVLWLARLMAIREHRFREAVGLLATMGALFLVLGYCQLYKQKYGEFALTKIGRLNQLHIILQSGLYHHGSDSAVNELLDSMVETWKRENPDAIPGNKRIYRSGINGDFLWSYVHEDKFMTWSLVFSNEYIDIFPPGYVKDTVRNNWFNYALYSCSKFLEVGKVSFDSKLRLKFKSVYTLLLLEMAAIVAAFYFTRRIPWFWCVCWLLIAGMIFTAVVGAQSDWGRLVVPVFPLVILLIAKYVDMLVYSVNELKLLRNRVVQYLKEQND